MLSPPSRARLTDVFLRDLRRFVLSVRGRFFTRPKPAEPAVLVPRSADEVERLLGERHFEPNWDLSFAYFGEVCNLRRVEYVADHPTGYEWWQVHVRGYHHPEGIELTAHFETDPSESPDAHVDRVGIDVERGLAALERTLDAADVGYRRLSPAEVATLD
ncbi:hypothetical protein [Salinilacihabitans rarus]|uniref:hypothetical protein n=1 Tax=Salinilacihabitans rarus TaxID=2961596 RepID=UPI0020C8A354|nr:hypothetical protein [Salinilacihabitans rarus]